MATRAARLCEKHTMRELLDMNNAVFQDPANAALPGGLHILTPSARKLSDDLARAITWKMAEKRIAEGMPPAVAGYTGGNRNR